MYTSEVIFISIFLFNLLLFLFFYSIYFYFYFSIQFIIIFIFLFNLLLFLFFYSIYYSLYFHGSALESTEGCFECSRKELNLESSRGCMMERILGCRSLVSWCTPRLSISKKRSLSRFLEKRSNHRFSNMNTDASCINICDVFWLSFFVLIGFTFCFILYDNS